MADGGIFVADSIDGRVNDIHVGRCLGVGWERRGEDFQKVWACVWFVCGVLIIGK